MQKIKALRGSRDMGNVNPVVGCKEYTLRLLTGIKKLLYYPSINFHMVLMFTLFLENLCFFLHNWNIARISDKQYMESSRCDRHREVNPEFQHYQQSLGVSGSEWRRGHKEKAREETVRKHGIHGNKTKSSCSPVSMHGLSILRQYVRGTIAPRPLSTSPKAYE